MGVKGRFKRILPRAKYTEANKEFWKQIRADKPQYLEDLAEKAGATAATGNLRHLHSTKRKIK